MVCNYLAEFPFEEAIIVPASATLAGIVGSLVENKKDILAMRASRNGQQTRCYFK